MRERNPDLPILDELGRELEQLAGVATPAPSRPAAPRPAPRRRGPSHRRTARVTRRAALVLVLLCLVGGVALAARFGAGNDDVPEHTAPALLGRAAGGAWHVSAYRDRGRLCLLVEVRGAALTSECGTGPTDDGVFATSLRADGRRLVAGLAGPRIAAVTVRAAGRSAGTATHAAADPEAAAAAGVPAASRWFLAVLPAGSSPALVAPLDRDRKRLGKRYLDCSLGVVGAACQQRIRAAADAAEAGD